MESYCFEHIICVMITMYTLALLIYLLFHFYLFLCIFWWSLVPQSGIYKGFESWAASVVVKKMTSRKLLTMEVHMQLKAQQVISACQEVRSVVARVIYFNFNGYLYQFEFAEWTLKDFYGVKHSVWFQLINVHFVPFL